MKAMLSRVWNVCANAGGCNMKPIDMFATPNSMAELELWLAQARDPMVTTAAMMMYNLLVSKYDLKEKEEK